MKRFVRWLPFALVLLLLAGVGIHALLQERLPPEEKIRHAVQEMAEAAQHRRTGDILDHISETAYRDRFHRNKRELADRVRFMIFRFRSIRVTLADLSVRMDPQDPAVGWAICRADIRLGLQTDSIPKHDRIKQMRGTDQFVFRFVLEEDDVWRISETLSEPPEQIVPVE